MCEDDIFGISGNICPVCFLHDVNLLVIVYVKPIIYILGHMNKEEHLLILAKFKVNATRSMNKLVQDIGFLGKMTYWKDNWQQDLNPLDHDRPNSLLYHPSRENMEDDQLLDFSFYSRGDIMSLEDCKLMYINETVKLMRQEPKGFCRVTFDSVLCWPPVKLDSVVIVPCFSELNNVYYDDSQNATRYCLPNGTWSRPNYSLCEPLVYSDGEPEVRIYLIGYFLSLITLSVAMAIFIYFKELHCLRNTIHKNLMWSYILTYCCWIMTLLLLYYGSNMSVICNFTVILLHYFHSTTFFWMFVEGLYLYILVVRTLTRENFKLRVYFCIGWGLPMIIMLIWAVTKGVLPFDEESISMCLWFEDHMVDWIYKGPQLVVLLLNVIFLLGIMWVLITKLRTSNSLEMQQYHKAAKALLVLTPLLGITYVVTIYSPGITDDRVDVFECARAVLLSTQGFTVALLYCFMNAEVQKSIRHHLENWKTRRSLIRNKGSSATSRTKDWWLRPRTESMRCTEWTLVNTDDADTQQEDTESTSSTKKNGDIIRMETQEA